MTGIVAFIIVLGLLIFVHELGHFLFAKLFGVGVETFSLGFGPRLFGWRSGETDYRISAVPLGGYVKMVGESADAEVAPEDQARSFIHKHPLQRMVIVVAGPGFNLLFAWLVYVLIAWHGIPSLTSRIKVLPEMPAAQAGLMDQDLITAINGTAVSRWDEVAQSVAASKGTPLVLHVRRGTEELELTITPKEGEGTNLLGEKLRGPKIGVMPAGEEVLEQVGFFAAVAAASRHTYQIAWLTLVVFGKIITGSIGLDNIGGPIMIAVESGKQAAAGVVRLAGFMAALSVNLAVLNLLPVPILDGGHLLFYGWEALRRRPVSPQVREMGQRLGFLFLISLMALAMFNDLARYWRQIIQFLTGLVN